jgi:hypothetical protein
MYNASMYIAGAEPELSQSNLIHVLHLTYISDDIRPHQIRDRELLSSNVEDYGSLDIRIWFPLRLMKVHFPGRIATCWQGEKCQFKDPQTVKVIDSADMIYERKIVYRSVEGMDMNGFVLFPVYMCRKCEGTKYALEVADLVKMNVPLVILRRAPVVPLKNSTLTKELYQFILTHMTSSCGAEQISKHISKLHAALWAEDMRVCLEMQLLQADDARATLHNYGFGTAKSITPFPDIDAHCGGLGRAKCGISSWQVAEVFTSGTAILVDFADAVQGSVGGQVFKGDGNYSVAKRMIVSGGPDDVEPVRITAIQGCKLYFYFTITVIGCFKSQHSLRTIL